MTILILFIVVTGLITLAGIIHDIRSNKSEVDKVNQSKAEYLWNSMVTSKRSTL